LELLGILYWNFIRVPSCANHSFDGCVIMVYSMLRNGSGAYNHVHENSVGTGDKQTNGLFTVSHQLTEQEICSRLTVAVMP